MTNYLKTSDDIQVGNIKGDSIYSFNGTTVFTASQNIILVPIGSLSDGGYYITIVDSVSNLIWKLHFGGIMNSKTAFAQGSILSGSGGGIILVALNSNGLDVVNGDSVTRTFIWGMTKVTD